MLERAIQTYIDEKKIIIVCSRDGEVIHFTDRTQTLCDTLHVRHVRNILPNEHTLFIKKVTKENTQVGSRSTLSFEEDHQSGRTIHYVYVALLGYVVIECHDITEQKVKEEELRRRAFFDHVTGLKNQIAFEEDIALEIVETQEKNGYNFALMFLDLNDFKKINDTHGHLFGDIYLQAFGQGLEARVREGDTVYRYAGDEFVVILRSVRTYEKVTTIIKNIHTLFTEEHVIDGIKVSYAASAGCALYVKDMTSDALVHACDMAMYESKKRKKDESFPYTITSSVIV